MLHQDIIVKGLKKKNCFGHAQKLIFKCLMDQSVSFHINMKTDSFIWYVFLFKNQLMCLFSSSENIRSTRKRFQKNYAKYIFVIFSMAVFSVKVKHQQVISKQMYFQRDYFVFVYKPKCSSPITLGLCALQKMTAHLSACSVSNLQLQPLTNIIQYYTDLN